MTDRTVVVTAQLKDQLSEPATALNAILKETEGGLKQLADTAQGQASQGIAAVGQASQNASGLVDQLASSLRSLMSEGQSLDSAVNSVASDMQGLYQQG